jgi:hypothetical protein
VQDSDFVDAQHDAANLGNRRPGKPIIRVQQLQPALKVECGLMSSAISFPPAGG